MIRLLSHLIFSTTLLLAASGQTTSGASSKTMQTAKQPELILIAGAGQAGMGAQTAAQSSAASSAGSNAAATSSSPATTPSTFSGASPGASAPAIFSGPSFQPNSSSSSITTPTSPNGPAVSGPNSANDNSLGAGAAGRGDQGSAGAPGVPPNSFNNFASGSSKSHDAGSSTSTSSSAAPQLRGQIGGSNKTSDAGVQTQGSIDSFFQTNAAKSGPSYALIKNGSTPTTRTDASHSALWHIMDNLGIPVPTGSNIEALDPTLRRNYVNPVLPEINSYKTRSLKKQALVKETHISSPSVQTAPPPAPSAINIQKIPDSELEGLDFSGKSDDQNKQK